MECNFLVGQKVEMVVSFTSFSRNRALDEGVTLPTFGSVYTIRNMEPGDVWDTGKTYLRFNELVNGPHIGDGIEPSFCSSMFKPVIERKTDISIFTNMLRDVHADA